MTHSEARKREQERHAFQPAPEVGLTEEQRLAKVIWETSRADESTISATGANIVARAILTSDWLAHVKDEAAQQERDFKETYHEQWMLTQIELDELVAKVEALADEWERDEAYSCVRASECVRCTSFQRVVIRLRALLSSDATGALDAVKAEAWDEGFNSDYEGDGWPPNPYRARLNDGSGS